MNYFAKRSSLVDEAWGPIYREKSILIVEGKDLPNMHNWAEKGSQNAKSGNLESDGDRRPSRMCAATAGARRANQCSGPPQKIHLEEKSHPATAGSRAAVRRRRDRLSGLQRGDRRPRYCGPPKKGGESEMPWICSKINHILKIFSFYNKDWLSPINRTSSFMKQRASLWKIIHRD